jgi:hypothetical protein
MVVMSAVMSRPVLAQAAGAPLAEEKEQPSGWYGYELMLGDVAALGTAAALAKTSGGTAGLIGVVGFVGLPPLIHSLEGNGRLAVYSPIYRVLLPVFGALIGAGLESCSSGEWFCGVGGAIVGGGIGMAGAMAIDYSLARQCPTSVEPSAPAHAAVDHTSPVNVTVAGVAPTSKGASLVLGGRF